MRTSVYKMEMTVFNKNTSEDRLSVDCVMLKYCCAINVIPWCFLLRHKCPVAHDSSKH